MLQIKFASCECVSGLMCLLILRRAWLAYHRLAASRNLPTEGLYVPSLFPISRAAKQGGRRGLLLQTRTEIPLSDRKRLQRPRVAEARQFGTSAGNSPESSLIFQVMHNYKWCAAADRRRRGARNVMG